MTTWTTIVGNVGTVYEGTNGFTAKQLYEYWVRLSKGSQGRASGEPVTLLRDDEIHKQHDGSLTRD